jgi:hypothetical protein
MRFLFGDSTPFGLQYNFLQTLEVFMASATRIIELDAQSRHAQAQISESSTMRAQGVDVLDRFHQAVMRALRDTASRVTDGLTVDYAQQLAEYANRIVEGARGQASSATDREMAQANAEAERRRAEIRGAIEAFFKVAKLPVLGSTTAMRLPVAREPVHEMSAVISFAEGIVVGYTLAGDALPEWRHPRKISEFAPGITLMIGAKKSWFKKTVQPDLVHLDELILGGFELSEDAAFIRLRRKPEMPDSYVFTIRRVDTHLQAEVQYADDPEAQGQLPTAVEASDRAHLERLWTMLKKSIGPATEHKTRVVSIHLDGEEIFVADKVLALVMRLIQMMAPTVAEIARRSPNQQELSLKIEHDGGRREEIYVKKADLVSKLIPLAPPEVAVFAPLALGQAEAASPSQAPPLVPSIERPSGG